MHSPLSYSYRPRSHTNNQHGGTHLGGIVGAWECDRCSCQMCTFRMSVQSIKHTSLI